MLSVFFYIFVFIIVFIIQSIAQKQMNDRKKRRLIILGFAVMLLLIGCRYYVGVDYAEYLEMYGEYSSMPFSDIWAGRGDIGAKIIIGFLAPNIFKTPLSVFWIYGFLMLIPLYLINKRSNFKYVAYSTLAYNLLILPTSLNIVRQGAAIPYVLLSFYYLANDNKISKAVLSMLFAVMLHTSAAMALPYLVLLCISRKKRKNRFYIFTLLITIIISVSFSTFLSETLQNLGLFNDYNYMLIVSSDIRVSAGYIVSNIIFYIPLIFGCLLSNTKNKQEAIEVRNNMAMILSGTIYEIAGSAFKNLSRVSYYFSIFYIIAMPKLLYNIDNPRRRKLMKCICIASLIAIFIIRCQIQGRYGILPYQTWLFGGAY